MTSHRNCVRSQYYSKNNRLFLMYRFVFICRNCSQLVSRTTRGRLWIRTDRKQTVVIVTQSISAQTRHSDTKTAESDGFNFHKLSRCSMLIQLAPVNSTTGNSTNQLNLTICSGHTPLIPYVKSNPKLNHAKFD